jgi:predicted nucleotidyltransferase
MNFGKITGKISYVPIERYEELISIYVDKVSKVQGVKSIVQIGSFSAPGLSDIDLIVIVDDDNPPQFEDISIKKILADKSGAEVVAHDVFIYPASLSGYIEGLFYIDQKKLLFGDPIGGHLPEHMVDRLKLILSFEYTIHRLESLVAMTSTSVLNIRNILLFISTLRHTYKLLADYDIISQEECHNKVAEIENLRESSIDNDSESFKRGLNDWIMPCFMAIYINSIKLGEKLGYQTQEASFKWILNSKKLIYSIDKPAKAKEFFSQNNKINRKFGGRVTIEPMPSAVHQHIQHYSKSECVKGSLDTLLPINLRYNLAVRHAEFLNRHHYPIARTYIIIDNKRKVYTDHIKAIFLHIASIFLKLKKTK